MIIKRTKAGQKSEQSYDETVLNKPQDQTNLLGKEKNEMVVRFLKLSVVTIQLTFLVEV